MHLVENYALGTGLKIGKPYINEKFVPLSFDGDYISFQPFSKYDSKNYDYWTEVIKILTEPFNEKNIRIVQTGISEEPRIYGTHDYRGRSDINQAAYLIKNSILHLGADSFGAHVASGAGKKVVALYSVSYPSQCGPYWTSDKDKIALEPPWEEGEKPCYCMTETPKKINLIKPEDIAAAVCKLLKIKMNFPFKTLAIGKNYGVKKVELLPESAVVEVGKIFGVDSIIVRMDMLHKEKVLVAQLNNGSCSIITKKPIDMDILSKYRSRIKELIILVDEETDTEYIKSLKNNGHKYFMITELSGQELNGIKLKYLDLGQLIPKTKRTFDSISEFKDKNLESIYFRSTSYTVANGLVYMSKDTRFESSPIKDINNTPLLSAGDSASFFEDFDHSIYYEKIA